jgi:hypothetical protein
MAALVPSSTPLGLVILHYSTMDDMRQKNLQMVRALAAHSAVRSSTAWIALQRMRADSAASVHLFAVLFKQSGQVKHSGTTRRTTSSDICVKHLSNTSNMTSAVFILIDRVFKQQ